MGVFSRPRSPWWWLWLESAPRGHEREKTAVRIGKTTAQRHDSRALAETVYHKRMMELAARVHRLPAPATEATTFRTFAKWYDENVIPHHRGREREREILPRLVAGFGHLALEDIDRERVIAWRTARRMTGTLIPHFGGRKGKPRQFAPPSARTVNREVGLLKQVMATAVPKHLDASPLAGLPDLDVVEPTRRTMNVEEEARILAELAPDDRAIFLVGLDTLSRLSDVLDLKRADDHGDTIDIRDPKNRHAHNVPVSGRLREALDAVPVGDSKFYFPRRRRAETERDRRHGFAQALRRACERADVPYGRAKHGITFHWSTRRTGATRMIRAGGDGAIATTQRIGNWKDPSVLIGIYQETMTAEMRAAVESVGKDVKPAPPRLPLALKAKVVPKRQRRA